MNIYFSLGDVMNERKTDNRIVIKYIELLKEWDYEKNKHLDINQITSGSHVLAHWKCSNGHEWQEKIYIRTAGSKCPYCAKKRVIPGENDFATIHPELLCEWNYKKNTFKPNELFPNSAKKVWWICEKGHEWQTSLNHRHRGTGCPICSKELQTSFPEMAITYYLSKLIYVESRKKILGKEI